MSVKLTIVKGKKAKKNKKAKMSEIENFTNLSSTAESKDSVVEIANKFILQLSAMFLFIIYTICAVLNFIMVGNTWRKIMNFDEINFDVIIFMIVIVNLHFIITTFWMPLQYYLAQTIDKHRWTQDEFNAFKDDFGLRLILLSIGSAIAWWLYSDSMPFQVQFQLFH